MPLQATIPPQIQDPFVGYPLEVPRGGARHVRVSGVYLNDRDRGPEVVTTIREELLLVPALDPPKAQSGALPHEAVVLQ